MTTRSNAWPAIAGLFLFSLGAACGGDDDSEAAASGAGKGGSHASSNGGSSAMAGKGSAGASGAGSTADAGGSATAGTHAGGTSGDGERDAGGSPIDGGTLGMPLELGMAGDFVILAKSGISTVPTSAITGDIGVSPAAASFITGFSLIADASNEFAISTQVTGKVYAADYTPPTPSKITTAVSDMELAFTDAAGRAPDVTELGAGSIGGKTLAPGVYKWGTGLLIASDLTLAGAANDVWIFQVAQDLTLSSGAEVRLSGGALSKNVVWQVAGLVEFGTTSHLEGVVLTQTSVTLRTGATVNGRLLAQTAVDMDGNTVVEPAP